MKYLKLFESFDDSDTMARYQLFEAETTMAFDFNREFITDPDSIKDLIEKYNYFYENGKSWSGGPPPREFVEYFNKNYSKMVSNNRFNDSNTGLWDINSRLFNYK